MKITRDLKNYMFEEEFYLKVYINKVDVVNYKELGHFDNTKVIIYHSNGTVKISGDNLVVSRLLNKEVLIEGIIKNIELGD